MALMLSDIAARTGCELVGDDCQIENVADITQAKTGRLVFINHAKYLDSLKNSAASAVILKSTWLSDCHIAALVTDNPRLAFAKAVILLNPDDRVQSGISDSAIVSEDASVSSTVILDEHVVVQSGCHLADNVCLGAGCVIGKNVSIGKNTVIHANVTIHKNTTIGEGCIIHSGVVIGTDGFGFIKDGEAYLKIPQLGNVRIGNNVDIGANTTIDRGALLDTIIHDGVKIDNQIQIAHNVEIGKHSLISAHTGIAGSTKIGENCLIGGGVGIRDNLELTDNVVVTGRTFVSSSLKEPGLYSSSILVDTTKNWKRNVMRFKRLDEMAKSLKTLEKKFEKITKE